MKWLAECSATALREALRVAAPELSGYSLTIPEPGRALQRTRHRPRGASRSHL